jgi:hypothetical protein
MEQRTPPGKEGLYSSLQNLAAACNLHQRLRPWPKRLWYRKGRSPWTGVPGVNPKFSDDHTESKVERELYRVDGAEVFVRSLRYGAPETIKTQTAIS